MKASGVIRFPGTNCDFDVWNWLEQAEKKPTWIWAQDQFAATDYDLIVIPGGFSFGDYLRSGALASRCPVMKSVAEFAKRGGPVLGICNGFQILTEAGLLPGALVKNESRRFIDDWVSLKFVQKNPLFGKNLVDEKTCRLPIAHGDGRYVLPADQLAHLSDKDQIWLTYEQNPNGSLASIAGVSNQQKNVYGLMPHPERALNSWMGGSDGGLFL